MQAALPYSSPVVHSPIAIGSGRDTRSVRDSDDARKRPSAPGAQDRDRQLAMLLGATARGDRDAFGRLYREASPVLLGIARRVLYRQDLAEEAVHDAFVRIWAHASRYESHLSAPMTWMASIVRNRALDMLRRTHREEPLGDESGFLDTLESSECAPDAAAIHAEHVAMLHAGLARLDPQQRRALTLTYFEGLSHPELAERLDAPLGTVKTWVRRGLLALRKQMPT